MTRPSPAHVVKRMWRRTIHDAPAKVAALLVAVLLWWFASNEPGTTTQRSLLVPLTIVGADANEVAVGVPARVEVVIAGPSERMERLRSTDVEAVLDLSDVDGEFARVIEARAPQALRVDRIVPGEVIGRLEAVRTARWTVDPLAPPGGTYRTVDVSVQPSVIDVVARDPVMERIVRVVVPITTDDQGAFDGAVVPIPIDADGRAIDEVRTVPGVVTVRIEAAEAIVAKSVPVVVRSSGPPEEVVVVDVDPAIVTVYGTVASLAEVTDVTASLPAFVRSLAPGRYAVPAQIDVAPGVTTAERVDLRIDVLDRSTPMGR